MQNNIQFEKSEEEQTEDAVELLVGKGYIVISRAQLKKTSVKKVADLIDFFYSLLQYYNRDRDIHYSSSKKDLRMAKNFIKSRQEITGAKKSQAISEAAAIVECVIKYEDKFGFKTPINSFSCFGQNAMKWVTNKAISIINREDKELEDEELHLYMDNLYVEQEKEAVEAIDESKIEDLKSILGGLKNGEKEKRRSKRE